MGTTTCCCRSGCCSTADHPLLATNLYRVPESHPKYQGLCPAQAHVWSRGNPKADPALGWSPLRSCVKELRSSDSGTRGMPVAGESVQGVGQLQWLQPALPLAKQPQRWGQSLGAAANESFTVAVGLAAPQERECKSGLNSSFLLCRPSALYHVHGDRRHSPALCICGHSLWGQEKLLRSPSLTPCLREPVKF